MAAKPGIYILSPRARRDLADIWLYTRDRWSTSQADDYYRDLVLSMEALARGGARGKPIDEIRLGYFSLTSGSHKIIYRETVQHIIVVRILHQRMNLRRHL